jgi:hypothetical protein
VLGKFMKELEVPTILHKTVDFFFFYSTHNIPHCHQDFRVIISNNNFRVIPSSCIHKFK